ncbi:tryptophan-rich sensory protein [uncultured Kriegella sp.]|uniref:tryptophan-rich sensory protein n=1 Tax=uncultured Kriegella sp. TaxID=1798910 RepID=UPI0030D9F901|tara:strand:+ start:33455 stop:34255 length:801 start_codon:yes stop_codon:yes gene_type:complete
MKKTFAVLNLLSVILVIGINYTSQSLRLNDTTIGEISSKYSNLFTPASYAFAIWGLIFVSLLAYAIFQIRRTFFSSKENGFIKQTGYWFASANLLNGAWVIAFLYDYTALSVIIMLGILFSLLKIIIKTNMERWDAPIEIIAFVWWPICLYSGWISVATIANISLYLTKIGWDGTFLSEQQWTILMIVVATALNIAMIFYRNMREFAAVGVWALFAIFTRHKGSLDTLAHLALFCSFILLAFIAIHGYQNRGTNPLFKWRERLKER